MKRGIIRCRGKDAKRKQENARQPIGDPAGKCIRSLKGESHEGNDKVQKCKYDDKQKRETAKWDKGLVFLRGNGGRFPF